MVFVSRAVRKNVSVYPYKLFIYILNVQLISFDDNLLLIDNSEFHWHEKINEYLIINISHSLWPNKFPYEIFSRVMWLSYGHWLYVNEGRCGICLWASYPMTQKNNFSAALECPFGIYFVVQCYFADIFSLFVVYSLLSDYFYKNLLWNYWATIIIEVSILKNCVLWSLMPANQHG